MVHACAFGRTQAAVALQTSGAAHVPGSLVPVGTFTHVPSIPPTAHEVQVPAQAALQQTPSTQLPLVHSLAPAQPEPLASRGRQTSTSQ